MNSTLEQYTINNISIAKSLFEKGDLEKGNALLDMVIDCWNCQDDNHFTHTYAIGESRVQTYPLDSLNDNVATMFRKISRILCFSDYTDEGVEDIVLFGRKIDYTGWQRGLEFTFTDAETGEIVFDECFPEWDH